MKIACISASRVPSGTANSIQAMKVCQSLAQVGSEVRLWLPGDHSTPWETLAEQYGLETAFAIDDVRMGVNYGLNRVRFANPVPAGSRVRGHFKLLSYDPLEGGAQLTIEVSMELEGAEKPACVAQSVSRRYI